MPDESKASSIPTKDDSGRVLTLFDCICIIVGTIIGAGIFKMPALVAANVPNTYWLVAVWIIGGLIALAGALCFAELTTCYPDKGGDYGYLKRGYHQRVGFAFSWAAFWIIRPGNIGATAMIFGKFASQAFLTNVSPFFYAAASVFLMSVINLAGVRLGKWTLNVLTVAKVAGILLIIFAAFLIWAPDAGPDTIRNKGGNVASPTNSIETDQEPGTVKDPSGESSSEAKTIEQGGNESQTQNSSSEQPAADEQETSLWNSFWLAMVFAMFAYGGWNDIAFVATEVKNPRYNLLRSLVLGTLGVVAIYLLVNFALVYGIGYAEMANPAKNPTSTLVQMNMGETGLRLFAALVSLSCLGAINAMIFTSPRIYSATAKDYPELGWLASSVDQPGWWRGLVLQMVVTLSFIFAFSYHKADGIENIVTATAPYFWLFLALTIISLVICRFRFDTTKFVGYRGPIFPVLPVIFTLACLFMIWSCVKHSLNNEILWTPTICIAIWMAIGFGLSFFIGKRPESEHDEQSH